MKKLVADSLISTEEVVQACKEHLRLLEQSRPDLELSAEFIGGGYYPQFPVELKGSETMGLENEISKVMVKYKFAVPNVLPTGRSIDIDDKKEQKHHFRFSSRGIASTTYIIHTLFGQRLYYDPVCISHVLAIKDQINN